MSNIIFMEFFYQIENSENGRYAHFRNKSVNFLAFVAGVKHALGLHFGPQLIGKLVNDRAVADLPDAGVRIHREELIPQLTVALFACSRNGRAQTMFHLERGAAEAVPQTGIKIFRQGDIRLVEGDQDCLLQEFAALMTGREHQSPGLLGNISFGIDRPGQPRIHPGGEITHPLGNGNRIAGLADDVADAKLLGNFLNLIVKEAGHSQNNRPNAGLAHAAKQ